MFQYQSTRCRKAAQGNFSKRSLRTPFAVAVKNRIVSVFPVCKRSAFVSLALGLSVQKSGSSSTETESEQSLHAPGAKALSMESGKPNTAAARKARFFFPLPSSALHLLSLRKTTHHSTHTHGSDVLLGPPCHGMGGFLAALQHLSSDAGIGLRQQRLGGSRTTGCPLWLPSAATDKPCQKPADAARRQLPGS